MSAVEVNLPEQIPGEDIKHPPFAPVPARLPMVAWPEALPEWDDLTVADQLDHIEWCGGCGMCADHRAWGVCPSCGSDPVEALPPEGLSRCCGSRVSFGRAA